jgi:toxin ParE1/3/4
MTLVVSSAVWTDLAEIVDTIGNDNPSAAVRVVDAARASFELIAVHPGIGRLRTFSQPGIRSWPIGDFPNYLVFYLPRRQTVQIVAVLHGARNYQSIVEDRL